MPTPPYPWTLEWRGEPTHGVADRIMAALQALDGDFELSLGSQQRVRTTYLDTADRRLRRNGLTLSHESGPHRQWLAVNGADGRRTTTLAESPAWPALAGQIAPGEVRDRVTKPISIRAVLPVAHATSVSRQVSVLNGDGKTVVRITWTESRHAVPAGTDPVVRVSVMPLRGYQDEATRVGRALLSSGEFGPVESTTADTLLRAADPEPERPAPIEPGMPADVAVATALLGFLDTIEGNVQGTIDDIDTEFLHDLRVAVRRTRSLIKLAGDVLPSRTAGRFATRFKWLGDLTTPTRDLDVYLLQLGELRGRLVGGEPADLDAFAEHLRGERRAAHRALVRGLRSKRFTQLCDSWRSVLTGVIDAGSPRHGDHAPFGADARIDGDTTATGRTPQVVRAGQGNGARARTDAPPIEGLAAERVRRVHRKVIKRARAITPDSPAEDVHSLRKRCKELRYILEVSRPLCTEKEHKAVIKKLKGLQDVLGEFQDGEVQSAALGTFARQMLDQQPPPPAATLLAMGELSAHFAVRQRDARHQLTDALPRFLGGKTQQGIEVMLP